MEQEQNREMRDGGSELSERQKLDLAYYEYCVYRHRGRRPEPYESTLRGYQEIERSSLDPLI
jgi:hypothetical protein